MPLAALYGIALFTFSVSSRRLIDSRLGVVDLQEPRMPPIQRKPALVPAAEWTTSHHTITVPTLARLSRARSSEGSTPRTPLIVTVHQQREVQIDEDDEQPPNKQRPRRGPRKEHCTTSPV